MATHGSTDTDLGLENIFKELDKFRNMCVKAGIPESTGSREGENGVTVAKYATWNELGVMNKDESGWFIPPRPFVRGWADAKREEIAKTIEKLINRVSTGKLKSDDAIQILGRYGQSGIRSYVKNGDFKPNSNITKNGTPPSKKTGKKFIKGKGSSKPLIDTKRMLNAITYEVINKPVGQVKGS
jgi:hypothetical protein